MSFELAPINRFPGDSRSTALPICRKNLYDRYKTCVRLFWTEESYISGKDRFDYQHKLTQGERTLIDLVLAFFASADSLINVNLAEYFKRMVALYDASLFYSFQIAIEDIHALSYAAMIEEVITDSVKKASIYDAVHSMFSIKRIGDFIKSILDPDDSPTSFARKLIKQIGVEGILFFGSFGILFWFRKRGLLPSITFINEYISRDETMHALFGIEIYKLLTTQLQIEEVYSIFREVVDIASQFVAEALPEPLPGLDQKALNQYIQHQTDVLLMHMGIPLLYNVANPFSFMDMLAQPVKNNYFEDSVSNYSHVITYSGDHDDDY